jgi:quercetin dioxygenase-like cupin family protein
MTASADRGATGSFAALPTEEPFAGVTRQALSSSRLTINRYTFEPRATFPLHSHPQEQVTVVEAGSIVITVAGSSAPLEAGEWSIVEPEVEHGITAGAEGARILAIVSPARRSADEYELAGGESG